MWKEGPAETKGLEDAQKMNAVEGSWWPGTSGGPHGAVPCGVSLMLWSPWMPQSPAVLSDVFASDLGEGTVGSEFAGGTKQGGSVDLLGVGRVCRGIWRGSVEGWRSA